MKIDTVIQMQVADNAAATLCTMLGFYGRFVPMEEARAICPASRNGTPPELLVEAADAFGLQADIREVGVDELKTMKMPVVVLWKRRHYTVLKGFKRGRVAVADPAKGEYEITEEKFEGVFAGKVIVMKPGPTFKRGGKPESISSLLARRFAGLKQQIERFFFINLGVVLLNLAFVEGIRRILAEDTFNGLPGWAVWAALAVEVIILLTYTLLAMRKTLLINDIGRRAAARSGAAMFKRLFRMPMEFFDQISAGELMQRMNNNETLDRSLILTTAPRVIDVVMTAAYLVLTFSYNPYVAVACLAVEVAYLLVMHLQRNRIALRARSMVTSSGSMNAAVLNGMGMIETIKMGGTERMFFNMWKESQTDFQDNSRASMRLDALTQAISGVHNVLASAALLFVGAYFMMRGQFDVAAMAAMQIIVGRMGTSLSNCLNTLNSLQTMRTNIERVEDLNRRKIVEEVPLDPDRAPDKVRGSLVVSHVEYRYNRGDPLAVDDVSFSVEPGEVFAIVGKTGCGKSTLLKLIADLYTPTGGTITYGGRQRREIPDVVFRSSIVTVDQESMMFEDTVRQNLKMWDDTIDNYAMVLAARDAQIHDRIIRERDGYDTLVHENGKNFSGGELQRFELARALETEPTMLLLDEFTSALDALTEERVMRAIRNLGVATIIVAHRLSTVRDADQIIVMDKGRIVQRGTHDELMEQGGLYRELVTME